tara:strand:- start:320 stop:1030 length:711 start_codon:yes stop_codon:yes gene_type:complete
MNIPKIIHQIWLGPHKKPDIWMNSWKINYIQQNPDWTYVFWSEKEINALQLKNKKYYDSDTFYTAKSDLARYEILQKYGGVFIDADSLWIHKPNNSLNAILNDANKKGGMFCAEEPVNKWSIANGVIGFSKNHPLLQTIIDYIHNNYEKLKKKHPRHRDVWLVTGPHIFTDLVKKYQKNLILDSKYFYPESFHKNNLHIPVSQLPQKYPQAIMFQYGYTSNNILHKDVMKNYIENN